MNQEHFKIFKYCPKEEIFDGMMTFTEARKFMDNNATNERRIDFQVFNETLNRWEKFGDCYHGGRKVYIGGVLFIIDPDYRNMWLAEHCGWYVWEVSKKRRFIISLSSKEKAEEVCERLQKWYEYESDHKKYSVEPSDVITND